jgi:hypothetical protein
LGAPFLKPTVAAESTTKVVVVRMDTGEQMLQKGAITVGAGLAFLAELG